MRNILLFLGLYIPIRITGTNNHPFDCNIQTWFHPSKQQRWGCLFYPSWWDHWQKLCFSRRSVPSMVVGIFWLDKKLVVIFVLPRFGSFFTPILMYWKNLIRFWRTQKRAKKPGVDWRLFFFSGAWIFLIGVFQLLYGVRPYCPSDDVMALFFGKGLEHIKRHVFFTCFWDFLGWFWLDWSAIKQFSDWMPLELGISELFFFFNE